MKKKVMIWVLVALAVCLSIGFFVLVGSRLTGGVIGVGEGDFVGKKFVGKIIDGDTVIIEGESVRLLGMDSDERGAPCYKAAKERIEELILDKEVNLEMGKENKDMYQRYLRYIFLDGENINLKLVEEGLAVARFYQDTKYKDEIVQAEKTAREKGVGCKWGGVVSEEKEDSSDNKEESVPAQTSQSKIAPPTLDEGEGEDNDEPKDDSDVGSDSEYVCDSNEYNCGDFSSHAEAQRVFEYCGGVGNDVHLLDKDKDGDACETLS